MAYGLVGRCVARTVAYDLGFREAPAISNAAFIKGLGLVGSALQVVKMILKIDDVITPNDQ